MSSRSTADFLAVVYDRNARAFNRSGAIRAVALDISKAFGRVDMLVFFSFFSIRVFFTDTVDLQDSRGRKGTIFYSTLPLPPAHEHWYIYLQLCMWDDYHAFLIATLVFTRLLLDDIYHLIELPFEWLIDAMFVRVLEELILGFCYSDLTLETSGFELASTIILVLQELIY